MQADGQRQEFGSFNAGSYLRVCLLILCPLLGVSCIRVASDPTATPTEINIAGTPSAPMPPPANTEVATQTIPEVASSVIPNTPTPDGDAARIVFAADSALKPISLSLLWRFEAEDSLTAMDMISLDGGPLPDIAFGTQAGQLYTLGLDQSEYWRHSFGGPVDTMVTADLDGDGIGEVAVANKTQLTLLEGGNVRWQFEAPAGIASILASDRIVPGQAILWLGTSEGSIIALDADGKRTWQDVSLDNKPIVQMIPTGVGSSSTPAILAGTVSGFLGAIDPEGRMLWQVDLASQIFQLISVDLLGDSLPEIAVGTERGLVILDHTGEVISRWLSGDEIHVLTDVELDRQGQSGIVVAIESQPGQVAVLDGASLRWQLAITDHPVTFLSSYDLDGDGLEEILAGDGAGTLVLSDGEGGIRGRSGVGALVAGVRPLSLEPRLFAPGVAMVIRAGSSVYLYKVIQEDSSLPLAPYPTAPPVESTTLPPRLNRTLPHYELNVELDTAAHTVEVTELVSLINSSGQPWDELAFNVSTAYWPGVFALNQTTLLEPGSPSSVIGSLEQTVLRVALPNPLAPGEQVSLSIDYSLRLPRLDPVGWGPEGNSGWGPNLVQLGDWYPSLVPFEEGTGWQTWSFIPVGDPVTSELADYDVSFAAPPGITVAAAGLVSSDGNTSRFRVERARAFGLTASSDYARFDAPEGAVPIHLYISSAEQSDAQIVLQTASKAVTLFEELYGDFPYPELVLAENGFLTSNEYSGFISLGGYLFDVYDGRADSLLVAITAHEVAHQWWYGGVGNDQVREPWLDEGMAMLSELFYYERYYPELVDQWWQFRVDRWQPSGPVGASIYDFNDSASFVHNVYGQSAHFLQQLRETMGEQAFRAFLREYYRQNVGQLATGETFFALAQVYTDADLSTIRTLYFGR